MMIMKVIEFILVLAALMMVLKVDIFKREESFSIQGSILKDKRDAILFAIDRKQSIHIINRINILIKNTETSKKTFYTMEAFSFLLGAIFGLLLFKGLFLMTVVGIAFMVMPVYYLMWQDKIRLRKMENELESAMTHITNSYMGTNDIQKSVELYCEEVNRFVLEKHRKSSVFDEFLAEIKFQSPIVESALKNLGNKVNNKYFREWIRVLILCQKNRQLKFGLYPVIKAMNDEKNMEVEGDAQMSVAWQTYFKTFIVCFAVFPAISFVNEDWYLALIKTTIGKVFIFLLVATAVITSFYVLKISKRKREI